jgi:hypothetical protein
MRFAIVDAFRRERRFGISGFGPFMVRHAGCLFVL